MLKRPDLAALVPSRRARRAARLLPQLCSRELISNDIRDKMAGNASVLELSVAGPHEGNVHDFPESWHWPASDESVS